MPEQFTIPATADECLSMLRALGVPTSNADKWKRTALINAMTYDEDIPLEYQPSMFGTMVTIPDANWEFYNHLAAREEP